MTTENPAVLEYRLKLVEQAVPTKADADDLNQIAQEVRGLRKTLIQFMLAISGSAVVFSFTVLQLRIH